LRGHLSAKQCYDDTTTTLKESLKERVRAIERRGKFG
jgi:hypothetical protein